MSNYFDNFPIIKYNGIDVRDITRRKKFLQNNLNNPFVFLPYTIKDSDRPEDIAYYYYGSVDYTWLVLLPNNIIDPYHQWPLSDDNFDKMLMTKYAEKSGKTGYEVIDWTQDETRTDNIVYYYKEV